MPQRTCKVLSHCGTGLALSCCAWNTEAVMWRKRAHPLERPCGDRRHAEAWPNQSSPEEPSWQPTESWEIISPHCWRHQGWSGSVKQRKLPYRARLLLPRVWGYHDLGLIVLTWTHSWNGAPRWGLSNLRICRKPNSRQTLCTGKTRSRIRTRWLFERRSWTASPAPSQMPG